MHLDGKRNPRRTRAAGDTLRGVGADYARAAQT